MAEVLTVLQEFDVFGNGDASPYGIDTPKINAQFVGVTPAVAFDVHNQPKLARVNARKLRDIEQAVRQQFAPQLNTLGGPDLAENLGVIQQLITAFKDRLEQDLLVPEQLELESLTTSGEWLTYWQDEAPLVRAKEQQRTNLPKDF
ncbi:hypothetical protein [Levilactobacillus suantsaiihabitans]|uniref:Uncharacterized protein n=1 Tax=Levilactobacillus suantsaiihabitans TaxID=2487722 RepID=A0A4Z0JDA3_9LACO|nr:hypothetical protein [Levilactobacillus suantsaiihabitans]TGD19814.1 hypothetical protein EGT51_02970 [Levilactobacillus suantsaiihabitans]